CYAGPPLLAKAFGDRRRYLEVHAAATVALAATNVIVDYGPRDGARRLPGEMGLWPIRPPRANVSWLRLVGAFVATLWLIYRLSARLGRANTGPTGGVLNWTPLDAGWRPPERLTRRRLLYTVPLAVVSEETYIRGVLWSRMGWLGRWRPVVNGTCWAFYHLNRPVKDMVGSILPGAILASYVREYTGNIYWTAAGHYISNAYAAWQRGRHQHGEGGVAPADVGIG
ncbi:MAG: CPBP family intramembrane metalloprotease, partial [Dehalococcoidia bacterium]